MVAWTCRRPRLRLAASQPNAIARPTPPAEARLLLACCSPPSNACAASPPTTLTTLRQPSSSRSSLPVLPVSFLAFSLSLSSCRIAL